MNQDLQKTTSKLSILVPYRDRARHLDIFLLAVRRYLPEAEIIIIEQADLKPFNRGALLNIGARYASGDYFALHDVDHIPLKVDYSWPDQPTQLVRSYRQPNGYLGGVTLISRAHFWLIRGFSNRFWGWGGEDNELANRVTENHLRIIPRYGVFDILPHPRPPHEFDQARWHQAQGRRRSDDGVEHVQYTCLKMDRVGPTLCLVIKL